MKKISTKLITIIVVILVVVNGINIFFHINRTKQEFIKIQDAINDRLFKRLQLTLSNPIWNMQYTMVKKIIQTEGLNETIDEIIVKDEYNNIITQYLGNNQQKLFSSSAKTIDIFHEKAKIATVTVKYNRNAIEWLIKKRVQTMVLETFFIIFILSIFIKFTIDSIVSKRLAVLTSAINRFEKTKEVQEVKPNNCNDEMGYVIDEFNNMQQDLKINWDNLNKINKTLESRVQEEVQKNREKDKVLFEQTKMAALGEMIGNIAHQWRQPLSVISTGATGIQLQQEIGTLEKDSVLQICKSINDNAQFLSKTIDDFTRFIKGDSEKKLFNLNKAIQSFLNLVTSSIKTHQIQVKIDIADDINIIGLENELNQCLINLFNNSKDVLLFIEPLKLVWISAYRENDEFVIVFKDNGGGIDEKIIGKVFEPYFTTKHQSQGTGLGLNMTYRLIVEGMHGSISVLNETFEYEGHKYTGAKFIIRIPQTDTTDTQD